MSQISDSSTRVIHNLKLWITHSQPVILNIDKFYRHKISTVHTTRRYITGQQAEIRGSEVTACLYHKPRSASLPYGPVSYVQTVLIWPPFFYVSGPYIKLYLVVSCTWPISSFFNKSIPRPLAPHPVTSPSMCHPHILARYDYVLVSQCREIVIGQLKSTTSLRKVPE